MSSRSLKSLHSLKIKIFFNINIFINLAISLALLNLLSFYLINALFSKNSILFICIPTNLNTLFVIVINKYKLYINKVIFSFLQWYL